MGKVKVYTRFTKSLHQTAFSIPDASFSPLTKIKICTLYKASPELSLITSSINTHKTSEHFTYEVVLGPLLKANPHL